MLVLVSEGATEVTPFFFTLSGPASFLVPGFETADLTSDLGTVALFDSSFEDASFTTLLFFAGGELASPLSRTLAVRLP